MTDRRLGASTASPKLYQSFFNEFRTSYQKFEKRAHVLHFMEGAHARNAISVRVIGHKGDAKRGARPSDRAVNSNCSFVCHWFSIGDPYAVCHFIFEMSMPSLAIS